MVVFAVQCTALILLSGLRSPEDLGLRVADVGIARRWVRVLGKGSKCGFR